MTLSYLLLRSTALLGSFLSQISLLGPWEGISSFLHNRMHRGQESVENILSVSCETRFDTCNGGGSLCEFFLVCSCMAAF